MIAANVDAVIDPIAIRRRQNAHRRSNLGRKLIQLRRLVFVIRLDRIGYFLIGKRQPAINRPFDQLSFRAIRTAGFPTLDGVLPKLAVRVCEFLTRLNPTVVEDLRRDSA